LARVDEEGFVFLLGRMKRFAKVSGEMVSLTAVEDALAGAFPALGPALCVAILARPDPGKGEVLVAVSNSAALTREEIRRVLRERGLPNLWMPAEALAVERIPMLATGKVHHRALQEMVFGSLKTTQSAAV
jgi:acyl-[acyl-carrier-protein]-phospholipid O-acyltransferase/long-chain-fatty-acid--[acyl-carrier-protein] ligase